MLKSKAGKLTVSILRWEEHLKRARELNVSTEIQFAKIMLKKKKTEMEELTEFTIRTADFDGQESITIGKFRSGLEDIGRTLEELEGFNQYDICLEYCNNGESVVPEGLNFDMIVVYDNEDDEPIYIIEPLL